MPCASACKAEEVKSAEVLRVVRYHHYPPVSKIWECMPQRVCKTCVVKEVAGSTTCSIQDVPSKHMSTSRIKVIHQSFKLAKTEHYRYHQNIIWPCRIMANSKDLQSFNRSSILRRATVILID
mgnify:CR=1 FL=1